MFDHVQRIAYACLSPRTHLEPLAELCDELGYAPCTFAARDAAGVPIYHTNVMLAVGTRRCVVAASAIDARDRERVLASLARDRSPRRDRSTRRRWPASPATCSSCARRSGAACSRCRERARTRSAQRRLARLAATVDRVVAAPIPTIETLGGGSVRCMLAEVFLPR